MKEVTDPALLAELGSGGNKLVTDPALIAQLEAPETAAPKKEKPSALRSFAESAMSNVGKFGLMGLPITGIMKGTETAGKLLDRAAYEGGGRVTDAAAKVGMSPNVAAGAGYAANVGLQALPMLLGGEVAKGVSPAFQAEGKRMMQSALKPTLETLRTGKAGKAIDTMLEEGVNVTAGGVDKLQNKITGLNQQIAQLIQNSPATVDKAKVASTLQDALTKFEKQVTPMSDLAAIEKAWQEFLNHPLLVGKQDIPVKLAQELKQGTYRSLGDKAYGELKGADIEAQKTLARGLKEEIAKAVPQVQPLNAEESKLLNALNVAERRVLMDANKNPAGLGWLTMNPAKFVGFMADRSPLFKSLIARMLYSGSEQIPATAARLGIGAFEAANNRPPAVTQRDVDKAGIGQ